MDLSEWQGRVSQCNEVVVLTDSRAGKLVAISIDWNIPCGLLARDR